MQNFVPANISDMHCRILHYVNLVPSPCYIPSPNQQKRIWPSDEVIIDEMMTKINDEMMMKVMMKL